MPYFIWLFLTGCYGALKSIIFSVLSCLHLKCMISLWLISHQFMYKLYMLCKYRLKGWRLQSVGSALIFQALSQPKKRIHSLWRSWVILLELVSPMNPGRMSYPFIYVPTTASTLFYNDYHRSLSRDCLLICFIYPCMCYIEVCLPHHRCSGNAFILKPLYWGLIDRQEDVHI